MDKGEAGLCLSSYYLFRIFKEAKSLKVELLHCRKALSTNAINSFCQRGFSNKCKAAKTIANQSMYSDYSTPAPTLTSNLL
jgi:hypothetical protein